MHKKSISWMIPVIAVGTLLLIADPAYAQAQEEVMKEKHKKGMMHEGMKGDRHYRGKGRMGMMRGGHHGGHGFFLGMRGELDLTEKQVARLGKLKSKVEKEMIRTRADLDIMQVELQDLLRQDKVDVKAVDAKIEKIGALETGIQKTHVHARLDARKILTAAQLKKHRGMKAKRTH